MKYVGILLMFVGVYLLGTGISNVINYYLGNNTLGDTWESPRHQVMAGWGKIIGGLVMIAGGTMLRRADKNKK